MTSLTAVSRAVVSVRGADDRRVEARRVADEIDALDARTSAETLRNLWIKLGREATGELVMTVDSAVTVAEARAACLAAIADPPKRGRGRPRKLDPDAERTTIRFPPALLAELTDTAATAGRSINDEVIARCAR